MTDIHRNARSIFLAAIEGHPPAEWPGFLDRACGGDPRLRRRVERLLAAQAELGPFRQDGPPGPDAGLGETLSVESSGTVIGPYRLGESIGEGGMGQVFAADQQAPIRRRVAVKVIKPGMDSREVVARFEAERQALALMDHPNIAKVLDAGSTAAGRSSSWNWSPGSRSRPTATGTG
jgi:serine/threonine protein kinase